MPNVYETKEGNYLITDDYFPIQALPVENTRYAGSLATRIEEFAERNKIIEKLERIEIGSGKRSVFYAHLTSKQLLKAIEEDKERVVEKMKGMESRYPKLNTNKILESMLNYLDNFEKTVSKNTTSLGQQRI